MVVEDELQGGLNVVFQQSVALATKIMFDMVKDAFHSCLGWQAKQQLFDSHVPCRQGLLMHGAIAISMADRHSARRICIRDIAAAENIIHGESRVIYR